MSTLRKWISALTVATLVSVTSYASAADNRVPTKTVKAWDLDLTKPAHVQTLYERVHHAAADVCEAETKRHWKTTRRRVPFGWLENCVNTAVDSAVRALADPRLVAVHTQGARETRDRR